MYNRPSALEALGKRHEISQAEIPSAVEMAFRWVVHNSALDGSLGDGVVIDASTTGQWNDNLDAIQKGPLSSEATAKIDALLEPLESESYYCNLEWRVRPSSQQLSSKAMVETRSLLPGKESAMNQLLWLRSPVHPPTSSRALENWVAVIDLAPA